MDSPQGSALIPHGEDLLVLSRAETTIRGTTWVDGNAGPAEQAVDTVLVAVLLDDVLGREAPRAHGKDLRLLVGGERALRHRRFFGRTVWVSEKWLAGGDDDA